jgi:YD repeat-containing protein
MKTLRLHIPIFLLAIAFVGPKALAQNPNIITVSPGSGITNTSVTISGTNFGSTGTVTFNGVAASNAVWGAAIITVPVPSAATTGNVVVTNSVGSSNGVQFIVIPNITAILPTSAPAGSVLEVEGTGFGTTTGSLTINTVAVTPTFWGDTVVYCEVPTTVTGSGPVVITTGGNASNQNVIFTLAVNGSISGTVLNGTTGAGISGAKVNLYLAGVLQTSTTSGSGGAYSITNLNPGEYSLTISATGFITANVLAVPVNAGGTATQNVSLSTPNIGALTPAAAPVGTVIVISGTNFGVSQGTVTFDGTTATPTLWTNTNITVPVPTGAKTGNVVVTAGGAASSGVKFTVGSANIAGTITETGGTAVSGATIKAYQLGVLKRSTTSSATGTYTLSGLTTGSFDVLVSDSGLATTTVPAVAATVGATTTENVTLSSTLGGISGTVTQSNGSTAISGATVNAMVGYTVVASGTTSSTGTYTLSALAAETYVVTVTTTGYDTQANNAVAVTAGSTTTANFSLTTQDAITYVYDQASRLTGVVNALGNDAVYNYDTAGNILSISQNASSAISIIDFSPTSGPVGTTVTVNGTGFSATKASDGMGFNGKKATITSATTTQMVATVPTAATSGTIGVTSPAGTATSSSPFTVTTSNGLPTVTSFSPSIATPGTTAVSIIGTNFDPTAANDTITVNLGETYAASATATTISTYIPGIPTTGHITVTTTLGVSAPTPGYLFIPPPGYGVSSVGYTGSTTLGAPATMTIGTAGLIGLLAVDVPQSEGLAIITSNNFSSSVPYTIYDPNGNVIGSGNISTGSSYIETTRNIIAAGTCTIMIVPGNMTGNVSLTPVAIAPSISVPIILGGSPVTVATTTPGQTAKLSLTLSSAPQALYIYVYDPTGTVDTYGNQGAVISFQGPTGSNSQQFFYWWQSPDYPGSTWYGNSGPLTLPTAGTYTINVAPNGLSTWGGTFQIVAIPASVTGTITLSPAGGPPAPVTIATQYAEQSAQLTFTLSSAPQTLYVYAYNPTGTVDQYNDQGAVISFQGPTGSNSQQFFYWWQSPDYQGSTWYGNSGPLTLTTAGTYTINIAPNGMSTWGGTFQIVAIPASATGTITLSPAGGPPAPVTIATQYAEQSAQLTFTLNSAPQTLYVYAYNPTGTVDQYNDRGAVISFQGPTGSNSQQFFYWWQSPDYQGSTWYGYSGPLTLPTAGTYTINITPNGLSTWGGTFQIVAIPANVTGTMALNTPVAIATSYAGQSARLSFDNTVQNQQAYLYIYNPTGTTDQYGNNGSSIDMLDPNSVAVVGYIGGGAPGSSWNYCSSVLTLSVIGNYTINFTPSNLSLWGATFELTTAPCP